MHAAPSCYCVWPVLLAREILGLRVWAVQLKLLTLRQMGALQLQQTTVTSTARFWMLTAYKSMDLHNIAIQWPPWGCCHYQDHLRWEFGAGCHRHFMIFRWDQNRNGGGVMLVIQSDIPVAYRENLETNCELLWEEIIFALSSILLHCPPGVGSIYLAYWAPPFLGGYTYLTRHNCVMTLAYQADRSNYNWI